VNDDAPTIVVSATVVTASQEHAARAAEVLARSAAGLMLDGVNVSITMGTVEDDDEGGPPVG